MNTGEGENFLKEGFPFPRTPIPFQELQKRDGIADHTALTEKKEKVCNVRTFFFVFKFFGRGAGEPFCKKVPPHFFYFTYKFKSQAGMP